MVFQVGCSSEERFPEKVSMNFEAMAGKSTVVNPVYPHNLTKEGQERHCRPLLDLKSINLSQLWLGVRDENKDKIIGVSQWNVYDRYKPPETQLDGPDDIWDTPADKEWAKALFRALMEYWRKVVGEATQPIIRLSIMAVAPKHQFRGVGSALTKWGMDYADAIGGGECVVESSLQGRVLFERHGLVLKHDYALPVPEQSAGRPKKRIFFMHRPRKMVWGGNNWRSRQWVFDSSVMHSGLAEYTLQD